MALLHADVCIIGNELSGFATGALLAQEGYRVVLIDCANTYETKPLGEYFAPTFPHVWQIPKTSAAAFVLEKLELKAELRQYFGQRSPIAFINDPHERLLVTPDKAQFQKEIYRAFGEEAKSLIWGLDNFNPSSRDPLFDEAGLIHENGFWAGLRAKKRVAKAGQAATISGNIKSSRALCKTPLADYLSTLLPYVQYQAALPLDSIGGHLTLKALSAGIDLPAYQHASPYAALKSIFAESLLRHGGEILQKQNLVQIETQKKQIIELKLDGRNNYTPTLVIDATHSRQLPALLSDGELSASLREHENLVSLAGQTAIMRWLLPRSVVPKILSPIVALPLKDIHTSAIMGIFNPWKKPSLHQSIETQADRDLILVVMAAWTQQSHSNHLLSSLEQAADQVLPFAKTQCLIADSIVGIEANCVWPQFIAKGKGNNRLSGRPIQTPLTNLLRCGRDVAPALGMDGEMAVALAAAKATEAKLPKRR